MRQTIVLSPTVFQRLAAAPLEARRQLLIDLLRDDVMMDGERKLHQEYDREVNELDCPEKEELRNIIGTLAFTYKRSDCALNEVRDPSEYLKFESEVKVIEKEQWKIILAEGFEKELSAKIHDSSGTDLVCTGEYLIPSANSVVRKECSYEFKAGDAFDFVAWIKKYLIDAKSVTISDGYVAERNAMSDLERILDFVDRQTELRIVTLSNNARGIDTPEKARQYDNERITELVKRLKFKHFELEIRDHKSELRDRSIETENFFINIGHGMGWTKGGKVKSQFALSVTARRT